MYTVFSNQVAEAQARLLKERASESFKGGFMFKLVFAVLAFSSIFIQQSLACPGGAQTIQVPGATFSVGSSLPISLSGSNSISVGDRKFEKVNDDWILTVGQSKKKMANKDLLPVVVDTVDGKLLVGVAVVYFDGTKLAIYSVKEKVLLGKSIDPFAVDSNLKSRIDGEKPMLEFQMGDNARSNSGGLYGKAFAKYQDTDTGTTMGEAHFDALADEELKNVVSGRLSYGSTVRCLEDQGLKRKTPAGKPAKTQPVQRDEETIS